MIVCTSTSSYIGAQLKVLGRELLELGGVEKQCRAFSVFRGRRCAYSAIASASRDFLRAALAGLASIASHYLLLVPRGTKDAALAA